MKNYIVRMRSDHTVDVVVGWRPDTDSWIVWGNQHTTVCRLDSYAIIPKEDFEAAELARDEAVARVEKLEAALEQISEAHDAGRHDGKPEPCPVHDADTMFAIAIAALNPQPEEKDDA
jgi:hypothetical protein